MADSHTGRHHAKTLERLLRPIEQSVAFAVAAIFPLQVRRVGIGAAELIHLNRMIDDEINGDEGLDAQGISARAGYRAAQGCEVHDRRNPGEVLH